MSTAQTMLVLGVGAGICLDPVLRSVMGVWAGVLGVGLVLGACLALARNRL